MALSLLSENFTTVWLNGNCVQQSHSTSSLICTQMGDHSRDCRST